MGASYKSDDDIRRRNGVGGEITSPYNPHLQSGPDEKGIGCSNGRPNNPPPNVQQSPSLKYQVKTPTSSRTQPSNPLRRSASVGDWHRKYLFLEDPEARRGQQQQEEGARDCFVEQQAVIGRTFDPLALREGMGTIGVIALLSRVSQILKVPDFF